MKRDREEEEGEAGDPSKRQAPGGADEGFVGFLAATAPQDAGARKGSPGEEAPGASAKDIALLGLDAGGPAAQMMMGSGAVLLLKVLLHQEEATYVRGDILRGVQETTGVEILLAQEGELYPGCNLQEMDIQATSQEAAQSAATGVYNKIVEARGTICASDNVPDSGAARMKVIVPTKATSAVIGPGGSIVQQIRAQTGMHVHIESITIPPGAAAEISEQVVSFDGPLQGVEKGLSIIIEILSQYVFEAWYGQWAGQNNSGASFPGLMLFQDGTKGGKSKGKGKEKGGGYQGGGRGGWFNNNGKGGGIAIKLLVPPNEASCVLGRGGATVTQIGAETGTRVASSGRNEFYPGTQLQELKVQGNSPEAILTALSQVLGKIAESSGCVSGGDYHVEQGGARLKVVVPHLVVAAIIGPKGSTVKTMRERSGMTVHIEETYIPPGPPNEFTEQVIVLSGYLEGAGAALTMILEALAQYMGEPWFDNWCNGTHCGMPVPPGFMLFGPGSGKGKGGKGKGPKGGGGDMYGKGYGGGMMGGGGPDLSKIPAGVMAARQRQSQSGAGMSQGGGGNMAVKMLVSPDEVGVLGHDPAVMMEIQQATGTQGMLSEKLYPGTMLQELTVVGPNGEAVFNAVVGILNKIGEVMGVVAGGDMDVQQGEARVKLVVPKRAAAAIIGPGGNMVKQIKLNTGIRVHVDLNPIPCYDQLFEQAIILAGKFEGLQMALWQVLTEVSNFAQEDWFQPWTEFTNTGKEIPGLTLYEGFYKKGGGKGGKDMW